MEKKYTITQIINFNPDDWNWRISSGYAGYDHKDHPNDESKWIYESDFMERKRLKAQYEEEYQLIHDFRRDCLPFGEYPEYVIQNFLNKRYFTDCE
jgi:hypothetical protein